MDYVTNTDTELREMLQTIGATFEELLHDIPARLRRPKISLPQGLSEAELLERFRSYAAHNRPLSKLVSFLGAGMYDHEIPAAVDALASRGEFATAYTPYQPEASQGTLQAIYEYQSLICELTGLAVANASLYDGASSLAEAVLVAVRTTQRPRVILSRAIHPEYRAVVKTYLAGCPAEVIEVACPQGVTELEALAHELGDTTACICLQSPNFFGVIEPMVRVASLAHAAGALLIACVNPLSLGILTPPGECGADLAVGEGQPLGLPMAYGGPTLGFLAARQELMRKIPGRIAGCTADEAQRRGFVLTLQAREQHIRREKASSNICTNEGLCALRAAIFLCLLGPEGLREVGALNVQKSHYLCDRLRTIPGLSVQFDQPFFNEFVLTLARDHRWTAINARLREEGFQSGLELGRWYPQWSQSALFCITERHTRQQLDRFTDTVREVLG